MITKVLTMGNHVLLVGLDATLCISSKPNDIKIDYSLKINIRNKI